MKASLIGLFILLSGISFTLYADVWAEREALEKIGDEINALKSLVASARQKSDPDSSQYFDYDSLLSDLELVQSSVLRHLEAPMEPVLPTSIDALNAEYTVRH